MKENNSVTNFNVWNYKPWWCQPWSIILTGIAIITSSWVLLHILWLSILAAIPIIVWWLYFLILYPRMAREMYQSGTNN